MRQFTKSGKMCIFPYRLGNETFADSTIFDEEENIHECPTTVDADGYPMKTEEFSDDNGIVITLYLLNN